MRDFFLANNARGKHALLSWDYYEPSPAEERYKDIVHAEIERKIKEVRGTIPRTHAEALRGHIQVCHQGFYPDWNTLGPASGP